MELLSKMDKQKRENIIKEAQIKLKNSEFKYVGGDFLALNKGCLKLGTEFFVEYCHKMEG